MKTMNTGKWALCQCDAIEKWEKVTTMKITTLKTKKEHQKICKPSLH
jgi:hypothetical protein